MFWSEIWNLRHSVQLVIVVVNGCFGVISSLVEVSFRVDFFVGASDVLDFYFVGALGCSSWSLFLVILPVWELVRQVSLVILKYKA